MDRKCRLVFLLFTALLMTFDTAWSEDAFIVSGNSEAPPIVWEENQKLVGLGPDLVSSILTELNLPFTIRRFGDWQNVQKKTKDGDIDLLVSAYRNTERETYLDFSIPYLSQPSVIIVKKGKEFAFTGWEVLQGKKGVSNLGESYGSDFDAYMRDHLDVTHFQFERAIQSLRLGEADYLIVDLYTALIYSRLLQGEDSITILDPPVTVQDFHIAVRKDAPLDKYLPEINKKLAEKIADGTVKNTLMSHYDRWQRLIDRRTSMINAEKAARSAQQEAYLKEQEQAARQRVMKTMVDREGLPDAAQ